jgi:hypothetical protein
VSVSTEVFGWSLSPRVALLIDYHQDNFHVSRGLTLAHVTYAFLYLLRGSILLTVPSCCFSGIRFLLATILGFEVLWPLVQLCSRGASKPLWNYTNSAVIGTKLSSLVFLMNHAFSSISFPANRKLRTYRLSVSQQRSLMTIMLS